MPIFRESGGIFSPTKRLDINDGGVIKHVKAAWINDGGVFKKLFPSGPIDAGGSGVIDAGGLIGSMPIVYTNTSQGLTPLHYGNVSTGTQGSFYAFLPLSDQAHSTDIISTSVARFYDSSRNIIRTSTTGVQSGSTWTPSNPVDEQMNTLTISRLDGVYGIANKYFADAPKLPLSRAGTEIYVEWEWVIDGQRYFYNFPPYVLPA